MEQVIDHVQCGSCGNAYDCERKRDSWGNYRTTIQGEAICGVCGCADDRLVRVESRTVQVAP